MSSRLVQTSIVKEILMFLSKPPLQENAIRTCTTLASVQPPGSVQMASGKETSIKQKVVECVESFREGRKKIKIYPPPARMKSQSILLPGPERIRVSGATDNPWTLVEYLDDKTRTVCDVLAVGMKKSSNGECLGERYPLKTGKYRWITYSEVAQRKDYIGSGLLSLGVKPSQGTMVGVCTKTRPEFVLVMLACSRYSMVMVPLFHCYSMEIQSYIINHVDMEVLFCENTEFAFKIMENSSHYTSLKYIIVFDDSKEDMVKLKKNEKFTVLSLRDLEVRGKMNLEKLENPNPDGLFCICFTSGTTGTPKGVTVTHKNLLSCIASIDAVIGDSKPLNKSLMCFLPCAHIYEMINEVYTLYNGGRLGFYSGTTDTLISDINELKPTVLPLVPKLMNKIYAGVKKKMGKNWLKRSFFEFALQQKERSLKKGIVSNTTIWDRLVFSKMQNHVGGGSIQLIFTASAPVSKEVLRFFRCSMGCMVFEVYGLSEVGATAMTLMSEHDTGFVGAPLPCNHIKLVSVPEMNYLAENDEGEICIRGLNVFFGYYKNHQATLDALDSNGWYHTGDIGRWLPNGALAITDRKKHIFKIAQGEYIIPERVESAYYRSPLLSQAYVDGDSDKEFVVAIVVPEESAFLEWAEDEGFTGDYKTLCQKKEVRKALLHHLIQIGEEHQLSSLQQAGNIHISTEQFSQDNDLLTPTLKVRRSNARKHFESVFKELYKEGNLMKKS